VYTFTEVVSVSHRSRATTHSIQQLVTGVRFVIQTSKND